MPAKFEKKTAEFIKVNKLFGSASRILLAVSGGADSTALLHALCALENKGVLDAHFICAHINHQLRGQQAKADEDFVIAQANKLNIPIITRQVNVRSFANRNKLSIETAARKLRIESLLDIAKTNKCSQIATAHHKNDNAETVLQRLARGTGFRGLGSIWPSRNFGNDIRFARPLLCVSRDEIIEYLNQRNLKWQTDQTNKDCRYRRNYIRHRLIPALQQECSSSIVEQIFELSQSARRFHNLVCSQADKFWPKLADCSRNKITLDLKMFLAQPEPIKVELVRRSLVGLGSGERDLTQGHFKRILQLAKRNVSNRKIELPDGFGVWREYSKLIFALENTGSIEGKKRETKKIKVPGQTRFEKYIIEAGVSEVNLKQKSAIEKLKIQNSKLKTVEWFDLDKVKLPLVVRFRQTGDRFVPLGQTAEKKIGKFLTAAKVPQRMRKEALIIADSEKMIWLWPIRMCEQAKIDEQTKSILRLQISEI